MLFLLDENVDVRVSEVLRHRGHEVRLVRQVLAAGTPDQAVAAAAADLDALIITHDRDFLRLLARRPPDNRLRWRRLGRISLSCNARRAEGRMAQAIALIEWEHAFAQEQPDPRVLIDIGGDVIRVER